MSEIVLSEGSIIKGVAFNEIKFVVKSEPVTLVHCSFYKCTFEPGVSHGDSIFAYCFFDKCHPRPLQDCAVLIGNEVNSLVDGE